MSTQTKLDKNRLYVYDLDEKILNSLKLVAFDGLLNEAELPKSIEDLTTSSTISEKDLQQLKNKQVSTSLNCSACQVSFEKLDDERTHFKSDFHTYNLKKTLKGSLPISLENFHVITEKKNNQSAHEDDSSSSDEDNSIEDDVDIVTKNNTITNTPNLETDSDDEFGSQPFTHNYNSETDVPISHLNTRSAEIYFKSNQISDGQYFGIYKNLFSKQSLLKPMQELIDWNTSIDQTTSISALFMVGGGHFAGAIASHQRANIKGNIRKHDISLQEQAVRFIEHKTFHRYTTRRKQGGSQSAMDNAKGKANSAGSTLRRYNEAALKADISNLLVEWKPYLEKCDNIFIRARSSQDRRIFTESGFFQKDDDRLKSFPFTTSRPTVGELKRAWCELTYLKILNKPKPIEVRENTDLLKKSTQQNKPKKETKETLDPGCEHTVNLINLVKKARAPLLISYMKKNKIDINFILKPESLYANTPTMLHYASQNNIKQMVNILLSNMKADPCIKNLSGKPPYDLTKSITTQRAFQIARYNLGEDYTSWEESHIGEPLSREAVEELVKKEEKEKDAEVTSAIEEELKSLKKQREHELESKRGKGNTLGIATITQEQNLNSLSEDQRRRLMREQRARAAEARLKKMNLNK